MKQSSLNNLSHLIITKISFGKMIVFILENDRMINHVLLYSQEEVYTVRRVKLKD